MLLWLLELDTQVFVSLSLFQNLCVLSRSHFWLFVRGGLGLDHESSGWL